MKAFFVACKAAALVSLGMKPEVPVTPLLAGVLERDYKTVDLLVAFEDARILEDYLRLDSDNRKVRKRLALLLLERLGDAARAVPHLEKIVEDAPESAGWHSCLARALRESGTLDEAAEHFATVVRLQPENGWAFYELGNTLSAVGRFPEAVVAYRSALENNETATEVRLALAKVLWASGSKGEAVEVANIVLQGDPTNEEALQLAGASRASAVSQNTARESRGRSALLVSKPLDTSDRAIIEAYRLKTPAAFQRAASLLDTSLRRLPNDIVKRKALAFIYLEKLHSAHDAIPHLLSIVGKAPKDGAWWEMLAKAQGEAGDWKGAAESYRAAVMHSPKDVWLFYKLARAQKSAGGLAAARQSFEEAQRLDPTNIYVRRELARCQYELGESNAAETLARGLVLENAGDADTHAILGEAERLKLNFSIAKNEYNEALSLQESHPVAVHGLQEIDRLKRLELGAVYYSFKDTDSFTQSGVFTHANIPITERLKGSMVLNDRFFLQSNQPRLRRLEVSAGAYYWLLPEWKIAGGGNVFDVENRGAKAGGTVALYYNPNKRLDLRLTQRFSEPVNDSYAAAKDALSQSVLSVGVNLHASNQVLFSATTSRASYSDGNVRKRALGGVSWYVPLTGSPVLRLETEWIDYAFHSPKYSSPGSYTRVRPAIDYCPRLTDWLTLDLHGELSYVCDIASWGTGITAGLRLNKGDAMEFGGGYMKYDIPGGQSTWSGSGFKVDLTLRF